MNAFQVSPIKGTVFAEWNSDEGYGARVQMLAIKGTNEAVKDGSLSAVKLKAIARWMFWHIFQLGKDV